MKKFGNVSRVASLGALSCLFVLGCRCGSAEKKSAPAAAPSASARVAAISKGPVFVTVPAGEAVAPSVVAELKRHPQRELLVYVGASWCEPCQYFHNAVESGSLDDELAGYTFVEFDAARDREALRAAGYGSRMIPLFAYPGADGRASEFRLEGSTKGGEAVRQNLLPRLRALKQKRLAAR